MKKKRASLAPQAVSIGSGQLLFSQAPLLFGQAIVLVVFLKNGFRQTLVCRNDKNNFLHHT